MKKWIQYCRIISTYACEEKQNATTLLTPITRDANEPNRALLFELGLAQSPIHFLNVPIQRELSFGVLSSVRLLN